MVSTPQLSNTDHAGNIYTVKSGKPGKSENAFSFQFGKLFNTFTNAPLEIIQDQL